MTTFPALQPYLDRGQLRALLMQDALSEATDALGPNRWDVDMLAGTLAFTSEHDPSRRLETRAHMVASIAPGPRSVLWGWAHPQGDPGGVAAKIRDAGIADGVAELASGELAFPDGFDGGEDDVAALAHELGTVAVGVTDGGPYYSAPAGGGTRVLFLLDAPLPKLTLATVVTKLQRMLSTGLVRDPRTALWSLAVGEGWTFQWTDSTFTGAKVTDGPSTADFAFNEGGQLTSVSGQLSAG